MIRITTRDPERGWTIFGCARKGQTLTVGDLLDVIDGLPHSTPITLAVGKDSKPLWRALYEEDGGQLFLSAAVRGGGRTRRT